MTQRWIIGEDPAASTTYLAHTAEPRFCCRIADPEDRFARLSSHRYILKGGYYLCDFEWIDGIPDATSLQELFAAAEQAWETNQFLKKEESPSATPAHLQAA